MTDLLDELELDDALPDAPFSELHDRVVAAPIEEVWSACLAVTPAELKTLKPLMALRGLPKRLTGGRPPALDPSLDSPKSLLDAFISGGFTLLRLDEAALDGRAIAVFGAVGKFWSLTGNSPMAFDGAQEFLDFDEPGYAKTVVRLEAVDIGNGSTRIETETRIVGTDRASTRKFAPYWALIRLPSGLIRRSWLAAIDRRSRGAPN